MSNFGWVKGARKQNGVVESLTTVQRFSSSRNKTKAKVIIFDLTNHDNSNSTMNQSEFEAKTSDRRQARVNRRKHITGLFIVPSCGKKSFLFIFFNPLEEAQGKQPTNQNRFCLK